MKEPRTWRPAHLHPGRTEAVVRRAGRIAQSVLGFLRDHWWEAILALLFAVIFELFRDQLSPAILGLLVAAIIAIVLIDIFRHRQGKRPAVWHVPLHRNRDFTGREELLTSLREALTSGRPARVTQAIAGLGGVGKTQLALEYVYRHEKDYSAVFWLPAEDSAALAAEYAGLARVLDLPEKDSQDQRVTVAAVHRWLNDNSTWLLVLDNAPEPEGIRQYLPEKCNGHVIITSRHQAWGSVADSLSVPVFPGDKAIEFLLKRTKSKSAAEAGRLAEELGYLPLALEQAAAYIEETACSMEHYLQALQGGRAEALKWKSKTAEYPDSIATTWQVALLRLPALSPVAVELLNLAAFLAPDRIPLDLLLADKSQLPHELAQATGDVVQLDKAKAALRSFSLAEFHGDNMSVHRLVQAVAYDRLGGEKCKALATVAVAIANSAFPERSEDVDTWTVCSRLLPHVLSAVGHARALGLASGALGRLLGQTGLYLHGRAQYPGAEALLRQSLEIREAVFGPEHPDVAESLNNLAIDYAVQGRHAEAEPLLKRALKIWEKKLGPEDTNVLSALNSLAGVCLALGKRAEAEPLMQRSLQIREKILPPGDPSLALSLNNLGGFYILQGEYARAEPLFQRALEIRQNAHGPSHPDVAASLNNLGTLYTRQGRYGEAMPLYQRALNIFEKELGPEHPNVGSALNSLAAVYLNEGNNAEAEPLLQRALTIRKKVLGSENPFVAESLNNLASLYTRQGRYFEAEQLFHQVIEIRTKAFGQAHPDVAASLDSLAEFLRARGRCSEAEPLLQRAVEIAEKVLGQEHPDTMKFAAGLQALREEMAKQK